MKERNEIDEDEDFDMDDVTVPDLGLDNHAMSEMYKDEVNVSFYHND
jgi:hypothetical protein